MDSTGDPGICSAANNSVAIKGTVNPATLFIIRYEQQDAKLETYVEMGSKTHMINLGKGGRIEAIAACLFWVG